MKIWKGVEIAKYSGLDNIFCQLPVVWKKWKSKLNTLFWPFIIWMCLPSYYSYLYTSVASTCSYRGKNESTACFDCWPKCSHSSQGHLWLIFTFILTTLNNTRQCFYQSKTVDLFWHVNGLITRKIWQCSTFKCTSTLASTLYQHLDWFWPLQSQES